MSFSNFSSYPPSLVTALVTVIISVDWAHNRDGFHTTPCCRRFFFASPVSDYYFFSVNRLNHYYEGNDSCRRHLDDRSPHLLQLTFLAFRSQPLGRLSYRFNHQNNVTNDFSGFVTHSQTRHLALPNRIRYPTDYPFASSCSPPHFAMTQLLSATTLWLTPTGTFTLLISCPCGRTSERKRSRRMNMNEAVLYV